MLSMFSLIIYFLLGGVTVPFLIFLWNFVFYPTCLYIYFVCCGVPGARNYIPIIGSLLGSYRAVRQDKQLEYLTSVHKDLCNNNAKGLYISQYGTACRITLSHPKLVQQVYKNNGMKLRKSPLSKLTTVSVLGEPSLLLCDEPYHSKQRKLINPAFHYENLKSMCTLMSQQTKIMIENWFIKLDKQYEITGPNSSIELDFHYEISTLVLNIVLKTIFGSGLDNYPNATDIIYKDLTIAFQTQYNRTVNLIGLIPILKDLPVLDKRQVTKSKDFLVKLLNQLIQDRIDNKSHSNCTGPDLLDQLLNNTDEQGNKLNKEEILSQCITFFIAGHETTANALSFLFYLLVNNPKAYKDCQNEVDNIINNDNNNDDHWNSLNNTENINKLKIIGACFNESLRLFSPGAATSRESTEPITLDLLDGTKLYCPKYTVFHINSYFLHRNPNLFENPEEFHYERFLDSTSDKSKKQINNVNNPFAYLPFQVGSRNCIGQNFATMESKIVTAFIIKHVDLEFIQDQKIVPEIGVTLKLKYGLKLKVKRRKHNNNNNNIAHSSTST